jgi:hypothetical protein
MKERHAMLLVPPSTIRSCIHITLGSIRITPSMILNPTHHVIGMVITMALAQAHPNHPNPGVVWIQTHFSMVISLAFTMDTMLSPLWAEPLSYTIALVIP